MKTDEAIDSPQIAATRISHVFVVTEPDQAPITIVVTPQDFTVHHYTRTTQCDNTYLVLRAVEVAFGYSRYSLEDSDIEEPLHKLLRDSQADHRELGV